MIWACRGDCETSVSLLKWVRTQCRFGGNHTHHLHQSLCWVTDGDRRCKQDLVLAPPYSLLPRPPPSWTWYANERQLQRRFQQVTWCGSNIFWEFLSQFPLLQYRPNVARRVKMEATEEKEKKTSLSTEDRNLHILFSLKLSLLGYYEFIDMWILIDNLNWILINLIVSMIIMCQISITWMGTFLC